MFRIRKDKKSCLMKIFDGACTEIYLNNRDESIIIPIRKNSTGLNSIMS